MTHWAGYWENRAFEWGSRHGSTQFVQHSDGKRWICKLARRRSEYFYGIGYTRDEAAEKALKQSRGGR